MSDKHIKNNINGIIDYLSCMNHNPLQTILKANPMYFIGSLPVLEEAASL